jgi:zinc transport system ATP-binding protein
MDNAIKISYLYASYGAETILEDINLEVSNGEILSIVGPNGSGKSTLLKIIMGSLKPVRGEVLILGSTPKKAREERVFGYLPQGSSYDPAFPLNVFDVVAQSRYAKMTFFESLSSSDIDAIESSLDEVDMKKYLNEPFGSLSGGQKQRVLIARALAGSPKILMLDEPSTGLDSVAHDHFYQMLVKLRDRKGLTIIMVSHDIGAVTSIVDRIACLKRKIHFHGTPAECAPADTLAKIFGENIYLVKHDKDCPTCRSEHD